MASCVNSAPCLPSPAVRDKSVLDSAPGVVRAEVGQNMSACLENCAAANCTSCLGLAGRAGISPKHKPFGCGRKPPQTNSKPWESETVAYGRPRTRVSESGATSARHTSAYGGLTPEAAALFPPSNASAALGALQSREMWPGLPPLEGILAWCKPASHGLCRRS